MRDPRMARRMSNAPRMSVVFTPINLEDINMADEQEVGKSASLRTFCSNHIKSIVTVIMMLGMIFCVVMIVMVHKQNYDKSEESYKTSCLDVAIIGSGISGAYTAWRLRKEGLRVHVYEMSDQVGGMFQTLHFPEFPDLHLDMGVMSYSPESQPRLESLIRVLQLPHRTSHPPNPDPPTFFLRNRLLTMTDLKNRTAVPYNLEAQEQTTPDQILKYYKNKLIQGYWSINGMNPLHLNTNFGLLLYGQGYQNSLGHVASTEGKQFLRDTVAWKHLAANDNAAQLLFEPWHFAAADHVNQRVLLGGMHRLPDKLLEQFKSESHGHAVKLKHRLECIREKHGVHQLIFIKTNRTMAGSLVDLRESAEVCSRHVILAVPPKAVKQIEWKPYDSHFRFKESLNSVAEYPVLRVFFLYTEVWFSDPHAKFQDVYTDMPIRHFKYLGRYDNLHKNKVYHAFLVAEVEGEDLAYIQGLLDITFFNCEHLYTCRNTSYLVKDISRQIKTLFNSTFKIPEPEQVIINDWTKNTGTGSWYNWKKGVFWDNVEKNMSKPEYREDVYLVGNGFCGGQCQHNVDGIFQNVDHVIETYFNNSST